MVLNTLNRILAILCFSLFLFPLECAAESAMPITVDRENAIWAVYNATNEVNCIIPSSDGSTIWVGTSGGLQALGEHSPLYTFLDGLPSNRVESLSQDDCGGLWVGTDRGLAHFFSDRSWAVFNTDNSDLPDNNINCLLSDTQGGVWIGTKSGLAHLLSDGTWQVFTIDNSELPDNGITSLSHDNGEGLWIGTNNGLGHRRSDLSWEIIDTTNSDLPSNSITALLNTTGFELWIGTTRGLAVLRNNGELMVVDEVNTESYSEAITCLSSDGNGGIWIGKPGICNDRGQCTGGDIVHLSENNVSRTYSTAQIGHIWPDAFYTDNDCGLWVGSYWGLDCFKLKSDGELEKSHQTLNGLSLDWIMALANDPGGGVLAATGGLLSRLNTEGKWELINGDDASPDLDEITGILDDGCGGLWIGTWGTGIAHLLSTGEWRIYDQSNSPLPDDDFSRVYADYISHILPDGGGGIWASTQFNGISHLGTDGNWEVYDPLPIPNYPALTQMLQDCNNEIWIGTWSGLAHLKFDRSWEVFSSANSPLPSDYIGSLLCDEQGRLWIGTLNGLACLKSDGSWEIFNEFNSGLPGDNVSDIVSDFRGGIWIKAIKNSGGDYALAHLEASGACTVFEVDLIPGYEWNHQYFQLVADGIGGVWVGTDYLGLVHIDSNGGIDVYSKESTFIPDNMITELLSDERGGLWVGTQSGLAHLIDGTTPAPPVASEIEWGSRGEDTFYCLDILDGDRQMLLKAVVCGADLHEYAPQALNLPAGGYYWKIWSPGGYGGAGFEGRFLVSTISGLQFFPWNGNPMDSGFDISEDANADILWRHDVSGALYAWVMDENRIARIVPVEQRDGAWQMEGTDDFDGDGKDDILWYNHQTTETGISFQGMIDSPFSYSSVATANDANWKIKSIADFDGDGKSDILWRHDTSGQVAQWKMDGAALRCRGPFAVVVDLDWQILSAEDFDGDGKSDILWRNTASGEVCIWLMNGSAIVSNVGFGKVDLQWKIMATGDFNRDKKVDILWQYDNSGAIVLWEMDFEKISRVSLLATLGDKHWEIKNTGDYDGDGDSDILWQNESTGDVVIWFIHQGMLDAVKFVAAMPDRSWKLK